MTVARTAPLEQRIADIRAECMTLVRKHMKDRSAPGVPVITQEMMIMQKAGGDALQAALDCMAVERRDKEIAEREWLKEHEGRQTA